MKSFFTRRAGIACLVAPPLVMAQTPVCPEKNVLYLQAFPLGGESDLSARHYWSGPLKSEPIALRYRSVFTVRRRFDTSGRTGEVNT
jgi:hypothetical protein